jgi:hypothetical protein
MSAPSVTPVPQTTDPSRVAPVWHTVVFVVGTLALTSTQPHQMSRLSTMKLPARTFVRRDDHL